MQWVTREHPKTDRIACPWLIRKYIDPQAEIVYAPDGEVLGTAQRTGAISFDAPGAQYTHRDGLCSFEVLIADHHLTDPALERMAAIVHGADISKGLGTTPESAGLLIAHGFALLPWTTSGSSSWSSPSTTPCTPGARSRSGVLSPPEPSGLGLRPSGGEQVHHAGDALQLHRADLRIGKAQRRGIAGRLDHGPADEHLALARVLGDPRGQVDGLAEVVALLEDDRPRVEAHVRRWEPRFGDAAHHGQGRDDRDRDRGNGT